jgi:hypothetical protein
MCWRAFKQGRCSGLVSLPLEGVGSVTVVAGRQTRALVWSHVSSFGRSGISHCGGGPIGKGFVLVLPLFLWSAYHQSLWKRADRQGRGLISPLSLWSAWCQLLLCRADMQGRSSGLASVPLVGLVSATVVCPPNPSLHVLKY